MANNAAVCFRVQQIMIFEFWPEFEQRDKQKHVISYLMPFKIL